MLYGKDKGPRPWYIFLAAMMIGAILMILQYVAEIIKLFEEKDVN